MNTEKEYYIFRGTSGKWFPIQLADRWTLRDGDSYNSRNIFDEHECRNAQRNVLLSSMAPEMFEFIKRHYRYLNLDDQKKAEQLLKKATEL